MAIELFGTRPLLVMDPVHGGIPLFEHERRVMDHLLFQRLRHVQQTDISSLVFPGATHSRFLHSLGVMHIASRIFEGLVRHYLAGARPADIGNLIDAVQYVHQCLRLAAILHDSGHLPFSHLLEAILQQMQVLDSSAFERFAGSSSGRSPSLHTQTPSHEDYSRSCAETILADLEDAGTDKTPDWGGIRSDVLACMEPPADGSGQGATGSRRGSERFAQAAVTILQAVPGYGYQSVEPATVGNRLFSLMYQIVNAEIGADRMDYLVRDSYYSGCVYGIVNLDHLISALRIAYGPDSRTGDLAYLEMAVDKKGVNAVNDFLYSRFQLYLNMYNHKTLVGMKWLLRTAICELMNASPADSCDFGSRIRGALSSPDQFVQMTDTFVWEAIRTFGRTKPGSACDRVVRRQHLEYLDGMPATAKPAVEQRISDLKEQWQCNVVSEESRSKYSDIRGGEQVLLVLTRERTRSAKTKVTSIKDHTDFFEKFWDVNWVHFYRDPFTQRSETDPAGATHPDTSGGT